SGDLKIFAGLSSGEIEVLDPYTLQPIHSFTVSDQSIEGIRFADLNNNGEDEILVTSGGYLYFLTSDDELIEKSQSMGDEVGRYNAFLAEDIDADGEIDIILGTDHRSVQSETNCIGCYQFLASIETA